MKPPEDLSLECNSPLAERGLSIFRRFRRSKKKEDEKADASERAEGAATAAESLLSEPSSAEAVLEPPALVAVPPAKDAPPEPAALSIGTLVASREELSIDASTTANLARAAQITPQTAAEIVPGRVLKRDELGRVHIKIVFYGPSLSGKTTALRWLFANVRSLSKGKIVEISDELGRTTFFDFVPVTASEKIVFDVFTVAGQRRHASSRIKVLRDCDGIIFMADSTPETMNENLASVQELRIALGTDRMATIPIIVALNKRDLPNALPIDYMVQMLDLEGYPVYATISTEGKNLTRMFQRVLKDALIFKVGI
jgi:signal recognition particle receptor subunit beta